MGKTKGPEFVFLGYEAGWLDEYFLTFPKIYFFYLQEYSGTVSESRTLKMKHLQSFETNEAAYSEASNHNPEELICQPHGCEHSYKKKQIQNCGAGNNQ